MGSNHNLELPLERGPGWSQQNRKRTGVYKKRVDQLLLGYLESVTFCACNFIELRQAKLLKVKKNTMQTEL